MYLTYLVLTLNLRQPVKTYFLLGNNTFSCPEVMQKKVHSVQVSLEQYKEFRDVPYYGSYAFGLTPYPVLTVCDLDMIENVFSKHSMAYCLMKCI
jgi:hypothetical protein